MHNSPVYLKLKHSPVGDTWSRSRWIVVGGRQVAADSLSLEVQSFQGGARFGSKFVTDANGLQTLINEDVRSGIESFLMDSAGSFTAAVLDGNTEIVYLINDPLGGGMILKYESENAVAFGFDAHSLRDVLSLYSEQTTRSVLFELSEIAVGTNYLGADSPIEEFQLIDAGKFVTLRPDGSYNLVSLPVDSKLYGSGRGAYTDLLTEGVQGVRRNAQAVVEASKGQIFADVTGGFDSRLVVAGLNSAQALSEVSFYSLKSSEEWGIASGIAKLCGRPISWIYPISSALDEQSNFLTSCLNGARDSAGTIRHSARDYASRNGVTSLSGGYGETFREFYVIPEETLLGEVTGRSFTESVFSLYPLFNLEVDGDRVFTDDMIDHISSRIDSIFERARDVGVAEDQLGNYLYLKGRNRFWIGQLAYWSSRTQLRFDILYDIALISAANSLDRYRRRANFVGLDAMRVMAPYLLNYPFHGTGHDRVGEMYRRQRYNPPRYHFPGGEAVETVPDVSPRFWRPYEIPQDQITNEDRNLSRKMGISARDAFGIRRYSEEALEALSLPIFTEYINSESFEIILKTARESPARAKLSLKFISALVRLGIIGNDDLFADDRRRFRYRTL